MSMLPLGEMFNRQTELKAKEKLFSEEREELNTLEGLIDLRIKYLGRFVAHHPHAIKEAKGIIEDTPGISPEDAYKAFKSKVNQWHNSLVIQSKKDAEDIMVYVTAIALPHIFLGGSNA